MLRLHDHNTESELHELNIYKHNVINFDLSSIFAFLIFFLKTIVKYYLIIAYNSQSLIIKILVLYNMK